PVASGQLPVVRDWQLATGNWQLERDELVVPGPESFPRCERLTRRSDFEQIYLGGEKQVGGAFVCYVVRRAGQGRKMGCTVSRKVGGAVVRNRVKRYLREIYRTHRQRLPEDVHMVIVARPSCVGLSYQQCEAAVRRLLEKGDVLGG
ncbi:MAG: ribonuclease P protein component, partial [Kiritimatiellae bacterium]|nr:ribonuclease P protein component [Kiritimatiellia bacterium]